MQHGVVSAGSRLAAETGASILRQGGNAVDAAIAANLTAFICEPVLTSPFGGGFALVGGGDSPPSSHHFFARTPGLDLPGSKGDDLHFHDVEVAFGPATQVFHVGRGSMAVPLMLGGLMRLQRARGALDFATVAEPAIKLAETGVYLSERVAGIVSMLAPIVGLSPESRGLFHRGDNVITHRDRFSSPGLANLLRRAASGDLRAIDDAIADAFGPPTGLISSADMRAAEDYLDAPSFADGIAPVTVELGNSTISLNPPPTAGGILVAFGLRLLAGVNNNGRQNVWQDEQSTARYLFAAMVITQLQRPQIDQALHRPESVPDYRQRIESLIAPQSVEPMRPLFEAVAREGLAALGPKRMELEDTLGNGRGETTHVSAVDDSGLACSITSSNGEGCGYVVPGFGAMGNNFMGEEDLHPHGFHSAAAGTSLTSMMCPTLIQGGQGSELALGTGGSNRIRTAILQVVTRHLLCGVSIEDAVAAPRLHWEGGKLYIERHGIGGHFDDRTIAALCAMTDDSLVFDEPSIFFGGVHAAGTSGHGAGDPRRDGFCHRC